MELKPLGSRVIIEPIKEEKTTESGIIIPETVENQGPSRGMVVAVGPGKMSDSGSRLHIEVKEKDIVLYKTYSPEEVEINGKKHLVIDEGDILAIIK